MPIFAVVIMLSVALNVEAGSPSSSFIEIPTRGTVLQGDHSIELGLRTDCFWDQYIRSPTEFMNLSSGRVTMLYIDLPWGRRSSRILTQAISINLSPKAIGDMATRFGTT